MGAMRRLLPEWSPPMDELQVAVRAVDLWRFALDRDAAPAD